MSNLHPVYRADIDGLRAVAVLSVVAYHAFPDWLHGGFVGVDIFFVISGYLISGIVFGSLQRDGFSFSEFYIHRVKRLFPALILVLLASYGAGWLLLLPGEFSSLGLNIVGSAGFIANLVLWAESGYFDSAAASKPLLHLWSLGIEEQFYLFWPLLLYLGWRWRCNLLWLILLILAASFLGNIWKIGSEPIAVFYLPLTRFWELLAGSLLAHFAFKYQGSDQAVGSVITAHFNNLKAALGLTLIVFSVVGLRQNFAYPGGWAVLPVGGAFLLIAAGPTAWLNRRLLANPVLVWFGLISYPLYLWHWPLLSFLYIIKSGNSSLLLRCAAVLLGIVLAWLTWRFVERPIRQTRRGALMIVLALGAGMMLVGGLGYYASAHEGLPSRIKSSDYAQLKKSLELHGPAAAQYIVSGCLVSGSDLPHDAYQPWCLSDQREAARYVLIGDSHADALYPGLVVASTPGHRWQFIGCMGCELLLGGVRTNIGLGSHNDEMCRLLPQRIVEAIAVHPEIQGVLISIAYRDISPNKYRLDNAAAARTTEELFFHGMSATIEALQRAGKEVYFIIDNPDLEVSPEDCLLANLLPLHLRSPQCSISRTRHEESQRTYRTLIAALQKKYAIGVVDPTMVYCNEKTCDLIVDGQSLYSYSHHLSDFGNQRAAKFFLDHAHWR